MLEPRHQFAERLFDLEQDLIRLGSVAARMLQKAMRSLKDTDTALAREVIDEDDVADDLDLHIETRCMRLLAQQQPMARDLRTIGSILKAIADLERVADFSCDIALEVIHLAEELRYEPPARLFGMGDKVFQMVLDTLDCFSSRDLDAVQRLCTTQDDEIDDLYREITDELLAHMKEEPTVVTQAARLLFVAHYLERIADHCTNVGERIHYIETGQLKQLNVP
ncbi:MAG TPA: phosphate signaling complex protein PhoU [Armatimonadota bacterium]|nr:phosphate signaling complex protein PhoU [Armatimonadota bacterium]